MKGDQEGWAHLERLNKELAERLVGVDTLSFIQHAGEYLRNIRRPGIPDTPPLSSPVRQIFHLLGLLLAQAPADAKEIALPDWVSLLEGVEELYQQLSLVFFPAVDEFPQQSPVWWREREVAMPVFLEYFNTLPLLYKEQICARIVRWFEPFDHILVRDCGLSRLDAIAILDWLIINHTHHLETALRAKAALIDAARSHDQDAFAAAGRQLTAALGRLYTVTRSDLTTRFPGSTALAFLNMFSMHRGRQTDYLYPTTTNPSLLRPLVILDEERLGCIDLSVLPHAIFDAFLKSVTNTDARDAFYRHRASECVEQTREILTRFLPDDCRVWQEFSVIHDTSEAGEHDLLVRISQGTFLAIEVKSTPPKEPFRDPERAFARIERAFHADTGVQGAYNQVRHLANLLESGTELQLLKNDGTVLDVLPAESRSVQCICVTADSYGARSTDLTLLLQKEDNVPYPWVVSLPDLETALEGLRYLKRGVDDLVRFLEERSRLHGIVAVSGDELEFVGAFLRFGSLNPLVKSGMDRVVLDTSFSDIFDEIYAREHGAPLPAPRTGNAQPLLLDPVPSPFVAPYLAEMENKLARTGRNEPCPCGSGLKFKKCHGKLLQRIRTRNWSGR